MLPNLPMVLPKVLPIFQVHMHMAFSISAYDFLINKNLVTIVFIQSDKILNFPEIPVIKMERLKIKKERSGFRSCQNGVVRIPKRKTKSGTAARQVQILCL